MHTAIASMPQAAAQTTAKRICLLGDNALLARDTAMQLRGCGYDVAVATEIEQVAQLSATGKLTCIVVDASGRSSRFANPTCAAQIRAHCAVPVPLLWLAARNDFEARLSAARADVDAYFAKPIEPSALKERIEALAEHARRPAYRVLLVGSDVGRLGALERLLAQAGMEVLCLSRPLDLIGTLSQHRPEAVVMDVHVPDCDGVDLARLIRQDKAFLDLPLLVLAENPEPALRHRAVSAGVDDVLPMPAAEDLILAVSCRIERTHSMRGLIMRDGLTGLYNHVSIKEQLAREIARSRREGSPLALAMIDLDFFKKINDTHGHPVGDQVIRAISHLLRQRLRHTDLVGRYGGEEFAVILPATTAAGAAVVLDEIREAFGKILHRTEDTAFLATFSAGVAELEQTTDDPGELFRVADASLYRAKQAGRNRVEVACPPMPARKSIG